MKLDAPARKTVFPKKRFSQNFLTDPNTCRRIVIAAEIDPKRRTLEIGCGQGALTGLLIETGAEIHGIEIDRDMIAILKQKYDGLSNFTLHTADILEFDLAEIAGDLPMQVIGNLPYHISSAILTQLMEQRKYVSDATVMLQKEVAERVVAKPHSKTYGILSVFSQFYATCKKLFDIPPGAFFPAPQVTSSMIRMTFDSKLPDTVDEKLFGHIVKTAFNQRRKMLRNSISGILAGRNIEFDLQQRPEQLSPVDFIKLTTLIKQA